MQAKIKKGFTLIEILLVITLLAILMGIVVLAINPRNLISEVNDNQREADALTIYQALEQYALKNSTYPEGIKNMQVNTYINICKTNAPSCNSSSQINLSSILVPTYISKIPEYSTDTNNSGFYLVKDSNGKIGIGGTKANNITNFVKGLNNQSLISPTSIGCDKATINGLLAWGVPANGVTISIPYIDGSGQAYSQQEITSTGVTGLTATLSSGSFANGSGNLIFNITGTPSGVGIANFSSTIIGNTCSFAANSTVPPIVTNGLVLHLDAGNPASYPGTGTTWTDLSGNNNNGTLINGVGFNSANGGSLVFDGVNDSVDFGNNSTLYDSYNNSFTQEYFLKLISGASADRSIFRADDWSRISVLISTSAIKFGIGYSSTVDALAYNNIINYNQWYCIHVVWSKLNTQKIYLNGILVAERIPTISNYSGISGTGGGANLGRGHTNPYAQYINGNIATFKHYNRALTASEIQQNFNALRGRFGL